MRVVIMLPPWVRKPRGGWPWWSLLTLPTLTNNLLEDPTWVLNQKLGVNPPKWMVKIMETPLKWDDFGGKPTIFGNTHMFPQDVRMFMTLDFNGSKKGKG